MRIKAEAYKEYGQAAILDKLLPVLPELMKAAAEPLSKIDKVTILSQGQGSEVGVNKYMGDIAKVAATAPAILEGLTGLSLQELLQQIPGLDTKVKQITGAMVEAKPAPVKQEKAALTGKEAEE